MARIDQFPPAKLSPAVKKADQIEPNDIVRFGPPILPLGDHEPRFKPFLFRRRRLTSGGKTTTAARA
jgi:hypothetical protein